MTVTARKRSFNTQDQGGNPLTDPITVDLTNLSRLGNWEITVHTTDADGNYLAADAGSATVEVVLVSGTEPEVLNKADGTTPEVIDFTAASRTIPVEDLPCSQVIITPSGITGASVTGIRVGVYEAE